MGILLYHSFAFLSLFSYGLYHLILSTRSFFKSPFSNSSHLARPYHPLPLPSHRPHLLRHLPLYLSFLFLILSISHHLLLSLSSSSSPSSPLSLSSLHTSLSLSLFLLLLLLAPSHLLPPDLSFLLSSLAFLLLSLSPSPLPPLDLASKTNSLSSALSLASALLSLALALAPRLFLLEIALASSLSLQGLWSLQTGLSLYVDAFIPAGCHRLLDVADPTTWCDLDDSRARAGQLLDLAFAAHAVFVAVVAMVVYVAVARACGGGGGGERALGLGRRHNGGSYEALPTAGSGGALSDLDHVQMKSMGKSSAQA